MKAWVFQDSRQRARLGTDKCPWSVGWIDPDGQRRSKKVGAKSLAQKYARKKEGELANGLIGPKRRTRWSDFRSRFESDVLFRKAPDTQEIYKRAMDRFEEACKPVYVDAVTSAMVDRFIARRLSAPNVGPATVNKELRHLNAVFKRAVAWDLLAKKPAVEMLREPEKDPEYVDDEKFAKLYGACDAMTLPREANYPAADWWRALLTFAYLTGWRIGEILALRREDVDWAVGVAFVEASETKGKRDASIELHPVVIDHLKGIVGFGEFVFEWPYHERTLWAHFANLKEAAEVEFDGAFHRFRFGFANANVDSVPRDVLQQLMRHQDAKTTQHYINMAARMRRQGTADKLHVPAVLSKVV